MINQSQLRRGSASKKPRGMAKCQSRLRPNTQIVGNGSVQSGKNCRIQPFRTTPCRVPPVMTQELRARYGQFCETGDNVGIKLYNWGKVAINWVKQGGRDF